MELREEIEALNAILMNDVTSDVSGSEVRVDMKLENCTVTVQFQGIVLEPHTTINRLYNYY